MSFASLSDGPVKHTLPDGKVVSFPLLPTDELIDIGATLRENHAALLHAACAQTGVPAIEAAHMVAQARCARIEPNALYIHIQTVDGSVDVLRRSLRLSLGVAGTTPDERAKKTTADQQKEIEDLLNRIPAVRRKDLAVAVSNMHDPEPPPAPAPAPAATAEEPRGFGDGGAARPTEEPKGFPDRQ